MDSLIFEHIFKWADPNTKKALSGTCRLARSTYIRIYFPLGLVPAKVGIKKSEWMCSHPADTSGRVKVIGMIDDHSISDMCICSRLSCRKLLVAKSFTSAAKVLIADGCRGFNANPEVARTLLRRILESPGCDYRRLRSLHDTIISALAGKIVGASVSDSNPHSDLHIDMALDFWLTPEVLQRARRAPWPIYVQK